MDFKKRRKSTPILMAGTANQFSLRHSISAYAMAALPLISPVPIQEVQLLDYAVSHKTVNSSYGLTANASDTYVMGKDPYTSDEQRVRDQYEINDTDWHEVSFKEVNGLSSCKLALHKDWIESHNYAVDGIVNMNLPEQGISGPFKITSIRHIQPQKIPVDEDPDDDYEYRPVTGLFTHQSNDVYTIGFTTAPSLGITATHPIYSATYHDWRLAGELEAGERVLTYKGEATVSSTEKRAGSETVYNLEVKDLHNFLVGDEGVVVHNSYIIKECFNSAVDYLKSNAKYFLNGTGKYKTVGGHHPLAKKAFELDSKYNLDEAFSISPNSLKEAWKLGNPGVPPANIHNLITGKQNSLYSSWRASNPAPAKMTFRDMIEIERQAMMQSGIPEDVANGWIIKGVEDLKKLGVKEITNIPWNGTN